MRYFLLVFLILTLSGPLWLLASGQVDFQADYRRANRESAKLAPDPKLEPEAIIQVYAAPAFNWRKIFAVHTWIAVKPKNASGYLVYQVVGWRLYANLPARMVAEDLPDRNWFNAKPTIILDLRGPSAEKLIPKVTQAVLSYPFPNSYMLWPGPNSNTFTAYVGRKVPELGLALPSNALGKDFLSTLSPFAPAPSGTGYQFSFFGLYGIMVAWREGLEINFLGLVYGFSPSQGVIKLPGFGDLKVWPASHPA